MHFLSPTVVPPPRRLHERRQQAASEFMDNPKGLPTTPQAQHQSKQENKMHLWKKLTSTTITARATPIPFRKELRTRSEQAETRCAT
jgi:hypothetical protein